MQVNKQLVGNCKYPGMGEGTSGKPSAATWPWFVLPHGWGVRAEAFHCAPPVLIASIPEETPGPSAAAADQAVVVEDEEEDESRPGPPKKWKREDKLISLIREDMRLQRETEARREWESAACMERLFSLLEKMSEHWLPLLLLFWVSFLFNLFIVNIHDFIHPSIHPSSVHIICPSIHPSSVHILCTPLNPLQGRGGAGAYPSWLRAKAGDTLDRSPVYRRAFMISFFTYFLFSVFQSVLKLKFTTVANLKYGICIGKAQNALPVIHILCGGIGALFFSPV